MHILFIVATRIGPTTFARCFEALPISRFVAMELLSSMAATSRSKWLLPSSAVLPLNYIRHRRPSASAQRNAGIRALSPEADLAGFLDDDGVEKMTAVLSHAELRNELTHHLRSQAEQFSAEKFMSGLRTAVAAFPYGPVSHAENSPRRWSAG